MNEYIEIQLRRHDRPLRIRRELPDGIELDEPDPITRAVAIGFAAANDITEYRLRRVRQLQGWAPGQFKLVQSVEDGSLVLRGVDKLALPQGRYTVRVSLGEGKTRERTRTITIDEDSHAVSIVDVTTDDRDVAIELGEDEDITRVLEASSFDGTSARQWLESDARSAKKACLLNLLASLRVRPSLSEPLINFVQGFYQIGAERAYATVDADFLARLEALASDPGRPFYREGQPKDSMHKRLIESIPKDIRPLFSPDRLLSFRGEAKGKGPSLQAVVAVPPPGNGLTFADIDLDLGNPLQDLAGFIVHMGELLGGDPTNHLDLRKKLAATAAGQFLYYKVTAA
jgi:hypothetical protein